MTRLPGSPSEPRARARRDSSRRSRRSTDLLLAGLLILAAAYTLAWARTLLVPLVLAVLLKLLLDPAVESLRRRGLPRPVASTLVLVALLAVVALIVWRAAGPAAELVESAPDTLRRAEVKMRELLAPVENVREAAEQVEEMADTDGDPEDGPVVRVEERSLSQSLFEQARNLFAGGVVVFGLLFFLLASDRYLLRRSIRLVRGYSRRKRLMRTADRLQADLSRYLVTIAAINAGLGIAIGFAMAILGVPDPVFWGALAMLLNYVPYLGAMVGTAGVAVVSFLTFEDPWRAVLVAAVYYSLTAIEGTLITPAILGSRLRLHPVAVFLGLFVWGWLWGIPGALLAVPLLLCGKIASRHLRHWRL